MNKGVNKPVRNLSSRPDLKDDRKSQRHNLALQGIRSNINLKLQGKIIPQLMNGHHAANKFQLILVDPRQQPTLLLVGSFHFEYYNLDAHKTPKDKQVNILSVQKQKEMEELVKYLNNSSQQKLP